MYIVHCTTPLVMSLVLKTFYKYCINNIDKLSSHVCHKCENRREKLKGKYMLCNKCDGDGYLINVPKTSSQLTC